METLSTLTKKILLYLYYKFVQLQEAFRIFSDLRQLGVRSIFNPPLILPDGTSIDLRRSYYDYLVLRENISSNIYEKYLPDDFSPEVILDLGAHKGFFSIMAAKHYPSAHIYAIEPNSDNYNFLVENTKPFPNIHPIHAAIWNKKGTLSLHLGGSSVGHSMFSTYGQSSDSEDVRAITFDDLPRADFIKCDIEGGEHSLTFRAPVIALEVHPGVGDESASVIENLKKGGYDVIYEPPIAYASLPSEKL